MAKFKEIAEKTKDLSRPEGKRVGRGQSLIRVDDIGKDEKKESCCRRFLHRSKTLIVQILLTMLAVTWIFVLVKLPFAPMPCHEDDTH